MESASEMLPCRSCGQPIAIAATFCSQCGQALAPTEASPTAKKPRWYYNIWFVLLMLFFVLGPFGLPLVWKNPRFSRLMKVVLTITMVVYTWALVDVTIRAARAVMNSVSQFNSTLQF